MTDFINGKQQSKLVPILAISGIGLVAILSISAILSQKPKPGDITPSRVGNTMKSSPKISIDLTGQQYCYSQLSNFSPIYYTLAIVQNGVNISGSMSVLNGTSGTITGTVDNKTNVQMQMIQEVDSSGSMLPNLPTLPFMNSQKSSSVYSLIGNYRIVNKEVTIVGKSIPQTGDSMAEVKAYEFYCSTARPKFWGIQK